MENKFYHRINLIINKNGWLTWEIIYILLLSTHEDERIPNLTAVACLMIIAKATDKFWCDKECLHSWSWTGKCQSSFKVFYRSCLGETLPRLWELKICHPSVIRESNMASHKMTKNSKILYKNSGDVAQKKIEIQYLKKKKNHFSYGLKSLLYC